MLAQYPLVPAGCSCECKPINLSEAKIIIKSLLDEYNKIVEDYKKAYPDIKHTFIRIGDD